LEHKQSLVYIAATFTECAEKNRMHPQPAKIIMEWPLPKTMIKFTLALSTQDATFCVVPLDRSTTWSIPIGQMGRTNNLWILGSDRAPASMRFSFPGQDLAQIVYD
jgi:hypothetical protein